jgi:hypothetical protein
MGANCTTCLDSNAPPRSGRKQPRARKNTLTRHPSSPRKAGKRKASHVKAELGSGSGLTGSDRNHSDDAGRGEGMFHQWKPSTNPLAGPSASQPEKPPRNVRRHTMEFHSSQQRVESDAGSILSQRSGDWAATATPSGVGPSAFTAAAMHSSPATTSFTMVSRHSTGMSLKGLNDTLGPEELERAQVANVEGGSL